MGERIGRRPIGNNSTGALSSVRNIKCASFLATSPPCHFVTFLLSINGEGEIMVAFDLLTGIYIRAIHRMALTPAPFR